MATNRTRYKNGNSNTNFYVNSPGGYVSKQDTYCKYNSLGIKERSSSSSPYRIIYGSASNIERMTDYVLSDSEKNTIKLSDTPWVRSAKECNHWKASFKPNGPNGLKVQMGLSNSTWIDTSMTFTGLPAECVTYWAFNQPIPGITRYDSSYRITEPAYKSAFQRMFKDSSLLNLHDQNLFTTIGELKDFRKTVQTVTKHVLTDKRYIADKYLGVNFGIIPFYSDMKNYVENFNDFAPNLKKWNDLGRKGKILNKHGTIMRKKESNTSTIYSGLYNWPTGLHTYKYKFVYTNASLIEAKCSAYFRAKPLESAVDNAMLLASVNGLSKPFTAAWNLIPFSFLVDWFANIGDQIDAFEYHKPVARFDIIGACHSVKIAQKLHCAVYLKDSTNGAEHYLGDSTRDIEFYYRIPVAPVFLASWIDGTGIRSPLELKTELSNYQWSLAAALAVTNFTGKK